MSTGAVQVPESAMYLMDLMLRTPPALCRQTITTLPAGSPAATGYATPSAVKTATGGVHVWVSATKREDSIATPRFGSLSWTRIQKAMALPSASTAMLVPRSPILTIGAARVLTSDHPCCA